MKQNEVLGVEELRHEWSETQRTAIVDEINRLITDTAFKNSERCVVLLRCMVDHALAGEMWIKERSLGVEAFGRPADYDTNEDPIVRRIAGEIRKRLAQCYQDPGGCYPIRIYLNQRSYLPEFKFADEVRPPDAIDSAEPEEPLEQLQEHQPAVDHTRKISDAFRSRWMMGVAGVLLVFCACFALVHSNVFRSTEYLLWKPLLDSSQPLTICVSDRHLLARNDQSDSSQTPTLMDMINSRQNPPAPDPSNGMPSTPTVDEVVAHVISSRLSQFETQTTLRSSSALTIQDLREKPAVLIGGTNNSWALILLANLRYRIRTDVVTRDRWIEDVQNPSRRDWGISGQQGYPNVAVDYAIVTRFHDPETGQWIMALSGLEAAGTEAAGQLVSNPAYAKLLPASVHSERNFQIVLKTPVIAGGAGSPQVLAFYTW